MTQLDVVLAQLEGVARSGTSWRANCPAHADHDPSLSVAEGSDGRVLLHCHAGCPTEEIVAALALHMRDLMPPMPPALRPARRVNSGNNRGYHPRIYKTAAEAVAKLEKRRGPRSAQWVYENIDGEPVGVMVRWDRVGGKKDFWPVIRTSAGWVIRGLAEPRPLYKLTTLAAASRIYVTEGEKAADAVITLGLPATTSAGGGKAPHLTNWRPLAGKEVIVFPDNDDPGRRYAARVADILHRLKPSPRVRIVELPGLPVGGDMVEFIANRDGRAVDEIAAELVALVEEVAPMNPGIDLVTAAPVLVRMSEVQPEAVSWLWPGRIPLGKLTLIAGDPGLGKSFVTLDMAACVSKGARFADSPSAAKEAGGVVLLSAEDDPSDTIRPRLDAAGADLNRIALLSGVRRASSEGDGPEQTSFCLSSDLAALEDAILRTGNCRLVIIDPISAYLPVGRFDSHRNTDVRALLAPLADLAARCRVAVVAVTHLRKGEGPALYRAMGSLAFVAAARSVWVVTKDPEAPSGQRRLLLPVKSNLAAEQSGLAYRLLDAPNGAARVDWEAGPVTVSADYALASGGPDVSESALDEATNWLRMELESGPVQAKMVKEEAAQAGIAPRTLDRAKARLKVATAPNGYRGPWVWRLPDDPAAQSAPQTSDCAEPESVAHSGLRAAFLEPPRAASGEQYDAGVFVVSGQGPGRGEKTSHILSKIALSFSAAGRSVWLLGTFPSWM